MSMTSNPTVRPMPEPIIIALITVAGGLIGAWITKLSGKKKIGAEAADLITQAASTAVEALLTPLTDKVNQLEAQVKELQCVNNRYGQRVISLMHGIEKLILQIKSLQYTPVWTPDEWDPNKET